jgi:hypothetical protein
MTVAGLLLLDADAPLLDRVVGALATGEGLGEVRHVERATGSADLATACRRLAETCDLVLGLPAPPWPGFGDRHAAARDALGEVPYWAVESWHGLPTLGPALADAVAAAVAGPEDRVLLTAPDAAVVRLPAEQRVFLREVAEALDTALDGRAARPTVAVDRSPATDAVTPTAMTTLVTLADAHGATRVVRCSLAPADGADPQVTAAAVTTRLELVDVALTPEAHVRLLLDAVATLLPPALEASS